LDAAAGLLADPSSVCRACGACCAYAAHWPRFTLEDDATIARIPDALVDPSGAHMAWTGTRCAALAGTVGEATSCTIHAIRPDVCRACEPGDEECNMARARYGLSPLSIALPRVGTG